MINSYFGGRCRRGATIALPTKRHRQPTWARRYRPPYLTPHIHQPPLSYVHTQRIDCSLTSATTQQYFVERSTRTYWQTVGDTSIMRILSLINRHNIIGYNTDHTYHTAGGSVFLGGVVHFFLGVTLVKDFSLRLVECAHEVRRTKVWPIKTASHTSTQPYPLCPHQYHTLPPPPFVHSKRHQRRRPSSSSTSETTQQLRPVRVLFCIDSQHYIRRAFLSGFRIM